MLNKIAESLDEAVADIPDGASIMVGGFGAAGVPEGLIHALIRRGSKDLTLIHNNAGRNETSIAALIKRDRVAKLVCTFPESKHAYIFNEKYLARRIELELVPQGTLAERIRAGGSGIEGFFTPTGVGTEVSEGKEVRELGGVTCMLELAIRSDYSFVKACQGDRWGNLTYEKSGRNFNPIMAMAGRIAIAEVDKVVELGEIMPEEVITPGVFVQRVVLSGEKHA